MKYIIAESRLEKVVTEYLNEIFPLDDVNYLNPIEYNDDTREEYEDETRVEFYLGDLKNGLQKILTYLLKPLSGKE